MGNRRSRQFEFHFEVFREAHQLRVAPARIRVVRLKEPLHPVHLEGVRLGMRADESANLHLVVDVGLEQGCVWIDLLRVRDERNRWIAWPFPIRLDIEVRISPLDTGEGQRRIGLIGRWGWTHPWVTDAETVPAHCGS